MDPPNGTSSALERGWKVTTEHEGRLHAREGRIRLVTVRTTKFDFLACLNLLRQEPGPDECERTDLPPEGGRGHQSKMASRPGDKPSLVATHSHRRDHRRYGTRRTVSLVRVSPCGLASWRSNSAKAEKITGASWGRLRLPILTCRRTLASMS